MSGGKKNKLKTTGDEVNDKILKGAKLLYIYIWISKLKDGIISHQNGFSEIETKQFMIEEATLRRAESDGKDNELWRECLHAFLQTGNKMTLATIYLPFIHHKRY